MDQHTSQDRVMHRDSNIAGYDWAPSDRTTTTTTTTTTTKVLII